MKVEAIVTEKILAGMAKGIIPWQKPWKPGASLVVAGVPRNFVSGKAYRGVNPLLLGIAGYQTPWWGTYKQISSAGGQVRKGEKSSMIVYFSMIEKRDDDDRLIRKFPVLRYFNVFNLEQQDGIEIPEVETMEVIPPDAIIDGYSSGPQVNIVGGDSAHYSPSIDAVSMPKQEQFESQAAYYQTLYHELTHSSGHPSRLARDLTGRFGSSLYAKEELIAEIGSAILCYKTGTEWEVDNTIAYLQSWTKKLSDDPRLIIQAASAADKAVNHMMGIEVGVTV